MPQKTWNPKGLSTMQCHAKVKCTPLQVIMARTFESFSHREPKMFLLTDKLRVSKFEFKEICYPFNVSHHKYFETEFLTYTLIDNQLSKKICLKRSSEMNEWMKKKQNKQTKKAPTKQCTQLISLRAYIDALANTLWLYLCACVQARTQMRSLYGEDFNSRLGTLCLIRNDVYCKYDIY